MFRIVRLAASLTLGTLVALAGSSCTTTYDYYGRPVQSVDPGVALAGVAAAGLIGYALADDNHGHHHGHRPPPCGPRRGYGGYGVSVSGGYGGYGY